MLSDYIKNQIDESLKKYPTRQSAVMDALMFVQKEKRYLTYDDMKDVADYLEILPIRVHEVATFYSMYNVNKIVGKYHIQVCRNLSCSLFDAEELIAHIENRLNIKLGDTTEDNKFTLSTVECLGSCGTAPVIQINETYYENLDLHKIDEILEKHK